MHLLLRHPKIGLGSLVYACSFLYSAVSNIYIFKFNATCLIKHKNYICRSSTLKGGLSLNKKIKSCPCGIYIHVYNKTRSLWPKAYTEIVKNNIKRDSLIRILVLCGNLKVGNPRLCCLFPQTQHRCLH